MDSFNFKSSVLVEELCYSLYELCDNIGERFTGTEGEKKAAHYIFKKLKDYYFPMIQIQEYPIKTWQPISSSLEVYQDNKHDYKSLNIMNTTNAEAEGKILDLTRDLWLEENNKINGKIVLIDNLTKPPFYSGLPLSIEQKASDCRKRNCKGIIIKNAVNQGRLLKWMSLNQKNFEGIPCCSISFEDGERLQRLLKYEKSIVVSLITKAIIGNGFSQNIIGEVRGNSNKTIVIGAHYDTVIDSAGALDNGSGVAVLLEILRIISVMAGENGFQKNLLFVFFGSEELGLQGSKYYVKHLQNTEQKNIKLMINLDEIGAGRMKGYTFNTSATLKNTINNLLVKAGSQYLVHHSYPFEINQTGDCFSFAEQGIETMGLWRWRHEAESSFNRYRHMNFDEGESMAHHFRHTKADTLDKVDISSLREYVWEISFLLSILLQNPF